MAKENIVDVKENRILEMDADLLSILLKDNSSGENLIWATDDYTQNGEGYRKSDFITIERITGEHGNLIKPRTKKTKQEQLMRVRDKAEVFTPSWVCNKQNNLVDNAWFGENFVFNTEQNKVWTATREKIKFPTSTGKIWEEYIRDTRLEITCGEAPYLASRYDTVTGEYIEIASRIGLLDRKLRVVSENTDSEENWIKWALIAYQNIYGYDWQGDNVLLARENLLFSFVDYYKDKFKKEPDIELLHKIAEILSWNIWQMDGLKFVIPESCHSEKEEFTDMLGESHVSDEPCPGCKMNDYTLHNGIYCYVMDWEAGRKVKFVSLLKK